MDDAFARQFAATWLADWNAHDIDAILRHFTEEIVFTSPMARTLLEGSTGVLRGKGELRDYWSEGLRRLPDLHFEVESLYVGVDTLAITYRNERGALVNEVLTFDGPLVSEGHAAYLLV